MKTVAIIPSRYGSIRLPGKPLLKIGGKPLIQHVYERAQRAQRVSEVWVATDDRRIVEAVEQFGGRALLTSPTHRTGTDRVAEATRTIKADLVVNVQGDEPLIDPQMIDQAIEPLTENPDIPMSTVAKRSTSIEELSDPNIVKVVVDQKGFALYFSRSPLPFVRDRHSADSQGFCFLQHIGLYVYRWDFLQRLAQLEQTPLEKLEKLEQLRVLENGFPIIVLVTDSWSIGVDTQDDLQKARETIEKGRL
jgi:3-deoxy-manno-octulosonate cytidylyltransferase (CMP-KDO synthetase)